MTQVAEAPAYYRDHKATIKANRQRDLASAFAFPATGWTFHSETHWSRPLLGDKLEFWPSTRKFRWRDKTNYGTVAEVERFVERQEKCLTDW